MIHTSGYWEGRGSTRLRDKYTINTGGLDKSYDRHWTDLWTLERILCLCLSLPTLPHTFNLLPSFTVHHFYRTKVGVVSDLCVSQNLIIISISSMLFWWCFFPVVNHHFFDWINQNSFDKLVYLDGYCRKKMFGKKSQVCIWKNNIFIFIEL